MINFYTEILPTRPAYDYIHYRNYFLMSTIIIILLQELNFSRLKEKNIQKEIKTISMKQFKSNVENLNVLNTSNKNQGLNYIDTVFDDPGASKSVTDDEVTYFDVEEFNTKGKNSIKTRNLNQNDLIETRNVSGSLKLGILIEKYKPILRIIFAIVLIIQLIYSIVLLFKSVTFSHFKIVTLFIHPVAIVLAHLFNAYSSRSRLN
jgi:hypothetical protein